MLKDQVSSEQWYLIQELLRTMSMAFPERMAGDGHRRNYATAAKLHQQFTGRPSRWPDDQETLDG